MRVNFLNECRFRNDGPPLFLKTNFDWYKKDLGIDEVIHKIPIKGDEWRWGKSDLYIWVDHGEDALPVEKYECPKPNVYWCSDSHVGMDYRLEKAKEFDTVFVSIPEHIEKFKESVGHDRVYWLPHAGEPTCYTKIETVKKYDVCFIGHISKQERIDVLDALFKAFPNFYYGNRFFEQANEKYCESKIVLNHCISKEANMRLFEATLSGSAVMSNYSEDAILLGYEDGKNIIFYDDIPNMISKAEYYLKHEDEREEIAKAGREHTLANHTYLHRAKKMLEVINGSNGR